MIIDTLNLEASEITGMNDDVLRTFIDRREGYHLDQDVFSKWVIERVEKEEGFGDKSNFFLGFSLSQIGFQSGTVTSPNANVAFMFDDILDRPIGGLHETPSFDSNVVVMFLFDASIMISVVPDSDIPVVRLSSKNIV
jgi:hypothetical protein